MYEISCEMCQDLLPLVRDGVASEASQKAVKRHLESCAVCRDLYESDVPVTDKREALSKAIKHVQTLSRAVLWGFVLLGIFLCESIMQGSSMAFVLTVLTVRGLLRIAFRKEKGKVLKRSLALLAAVAISWGILWAGNELFGNPITKSRAEDHIQGYLEGAFADSDYYIEKVLYNWSGSYEGRIRSVSDPELEFFISYRNGKIISDTYAEHVLDIWE